jgi:hypothetical protein
VGDDVDELCGEVCEHSQGRGDGEDSSKGQALLRRRQRCDLVDNPRQMTTAHQDPHDYPEDFDAGDNEIQDRIDQVEHLLGVRLCVVISPRNVGSSACTHLPSLSGFESS